MLIWSSSRVAQNGNSGLSQKQIEFILPQFKDDISALNSTPFP